MDSQGLETIKYIQQALKNIEKETPLIIYTDKKNYSIGKQAYLLGIKDFLIKGQSEEREIRRAITFATYSENLPIKIN